MGKLYIVFILCFLFNACSNSERNAIANLIEKWDGKVLEFPKEWGLRVYAGDSSVAYTANFAKYVILTYADSASCMSCKMNLSGWSELISDLDSVSKNVIPCLFVFNPKHDEKNDLVNQLRRTRFSYPVYIDEKDSFNILNGFPDKFEFQTFLIDQNKKVLAIGNPGNYSGVIIV